jgi:ribonuclease P protein component
MLPKSHRLTKEADFQKIFRRGKFVPTPFCHFKFRPNKLKVSRFAFVISNKISKKSVLRHKIKRRLSEIVRLRLKEIKPGIDCLIIAQPPIKNKNYQELKKLIEKNFLKVGLLKK